MTEETPAAAEEEDGDESNVEAAAGGELTTTTAAALVNDKDPGVERQIRRLLAEGKIESYEKAELVVALQDMEFKEDEALVAADNCDDVYSATKFLHQECELCASTMNVKQVRMTFVGFFLTLSFNNG